MCKQAYVYYLFMLMCCGLHAQDNQLPDLESLGLQPASEQETTSEQSEKEAVSDQAQKNDKATSKPTAQEGSSDQQTEPLDQASKVTNGSIASQPHSLEKEPAQEVVKTTSVPQVPTPPSPVAEKTADQMQPVSQTAGKVPYQVDREEDDLLKIDTIDLSEPKGNWLLKRRWWEKAQRTYEKIKQQVEAIFEARMFFYNQRAELDRNVFANFYQQVGIGEGELQVIVSEMLARLQEEDKSAQNPELRRYLGILKAEKEKLIGLQNKIDLVVEYDRSMNDALIKLREQINIARRYEQQAWNNFKQIAVELSDKRAHELFYVIKGLSKNIADINDWITKPYNDYFLKLLKALKQEIAQVKSMLQELKEKGIDVKQDIDEYLRQQAQAQQEEEQESQEEEESLLSRIGQTISWPFVALWNGLKTMGSKIAGVFGFGAQNDDDELSDLETEPVEE